MTRQEEQKIREYASALIAFMGTLTIEKQQRAYDYLNFLIERTLDKKNTR